MSAARTSLRDQQESLLRRTLALCAAAHPHFRTVLRTHKISADELRMLEDLRRLPLTRRSDLLDRPEDFRLEIDRLEGLSLEERVLHDVVYTSGSTSSPAPFYYTTYDHLLRVAQLKEACEIAGITPGDVIANLFPLSQFPHAGFQSALWGACASGAKMVAGLSGPRHAAFPVQNTLDEVVTLVERHGATVLWGIGTYLRRVVRRAHERRADLSAVHLVFTMGEPCPRGMRDEFRELLGELGAQDVRVLNGYGFTEIQGPAVECKEFSGFHFSAPANYLLEVLDQRTLEPATAGEEGLLVLTHLNKRGTVLLRYVVGDYLALSEEPCPGCGRAGPRAVTVPYRVDHLVKIKGALVNPARIHSVMAMLQRRGLGEYQIAVTNETAGDPYSAPTLTIRVSCEEHERAWLAGEIRSRIKEAAEVEPSVEFVSADAFGQDLERYKFRRFVDERSPPR